jgi:hypothetical protein
MKPIEQAAQQENPCESELERVAELQQPPS